MRVEKRRTIAAPRQQVWDLVSDPRCYPQFMAGLVVSEVVGDQSIGCGSRFSVRLMVGAAALGGTMETVEFEPPGDLAWNSVRGIDVRGRWRLRERVPGRTEVTFRLAYQSPGGLLSVLADRVASRAVARLMATSLRQLSEVVENGTGPQPASLP